MIIVTKKYEKIIFFIKSNLIHKRKIVFTQNMNNFSMFYDACVKIRIFFTPNTTLIELNGNHKILF